MIILLCMQLGVQVRLVVLQVLQELVVWVEHQQQAQQVVQEEVRWRLQWEALHTLAD